MGTSQQGASYISGAPCVDAVKAALFSIEIAGDVVVQTNKGDWTRICGGEMVFEYPVNTTTESDSYAQNTPAYIEWNELSMTGRLSGSKLQYIRTNNFAVKIEGTPIPGVQSIRIDPIIVPKILEETNLSVNYKTYRPGPPVFGRMRLEAIVSQDDVYMFSNWVKDTYNGNGRGKIITVVGKNDQNEPTYIANLLDCRPTFWTVLNAGMSGSGTISVVIEVLIGCAEVQTGKIYLDAWLKDALQVDSYRYLRDIAVISLNKDGTEAGRVNYMDCFITQYVFPVFDVGIDTYAKETVMVVPGYVEQL